MIKAGVTINRPPRDGRMAFIRSPDAISIELLQKGQALSPAEPVAVVQGPTSASGERGDQRIAALTMLRNT